MGYRSEVGLALTRAGVEAMQRKLSERLCEVILPAG